MKYEIGKVYKIDGKDRKVIGMDGINPITTTNLKQEASERPLGGVASGNIEALREQIRSELQEEMNHSIIDQDKMREEIRQEVIEEMHVSCPPERMDMVKDEVRAEVMKEFGEKLHKEVAGLIAQFPLDKCNKDELVKFATYIGVEIPTDKLDDTTKGDIVDMIIGA